MQGVKNNKPKEYRVGESSITLKSNNNIIKPTLDFIHLYPPSSHTPFPFQKIKHGRFEKILAEERLRPPRRHRRVSNKAEMVMEDADATEVKDKVEV